MFIYFFIDKIELISNKILTQSNTLQNNSIIPKKNQINFNHTPFSPTFKNGCVNNT
jgi:hypothetical protein